MEKYADLKADGKRRRRRTMNRHSHRRKKISDKRKGTAEIIRELSVNFTNVLHFLNQK